MWEAIKDVARAILPARNASPEQAYRWSVSVATAILIIGGLSVANFVAMWGLLPALFTGFAHADTIPGLAKTEDLQKIQRSLNDLSTKIQGAQIVTLGQQIYNLRIMECNARKVGNSDAARSHAEKIEELRYTFRQLANYEYELRPCAEL
jgi:hypothetical protein